jgi:hypothetical protein
LFRKPFPLNLGKSWKRISIFWFLFNVRGRRKVEDGRRKDEGGGRRKGKKRG